jgi:hypothetical protein
MAGSMNCYFYETTKLNLPEGCILIHLSSSVVSVQRYTKFWKFFQIHIVKEKENWRVIIQFNIK